jgi:hypothetical protein
MSYQYWKDSQLEPDMVLTHGKMKREPSILFQKLKYMDEFKEKHPEKYFENLAYDKLTDAEKQEMNDKHLAKYNL